MAGKGINWTARQRRAIEARNCDVLVSASAGTGKTAVLSQRCVDLLADVQGQAGIGEVLVVTFTDAAAEQMRSRITDILEEKLRTNPDRRLRERLLTLEAAHISTIHSFCKRIITENFHLLALDPQFRVLDQDQQKLLRLHALEGTIAQAWEGPDLRQGLEKLCYGRSVYGSGTTIFDSVISISEYLDGIARRRQWYERFAAFTDINSQAWAGLLEDQKNIILDYLDRCKSCLLHARTLDQRFAGGLYRSAQIDAFIERIDSCTDILGRRGINVFADFLKEQQQQEPLPRASSSREIPQEARELVSPPVKYARDIFSKIENLCAVNPDYLKGVAASVGLQARVLVELVRRFDDSYSAAKARINAVDFADLEHYMLKLLDENPAVAGRLREKFRYVFVDEYQDINDVQEAILRHVCRPDNVFVVGDVKQSIYAFRQSRPQIFLDRLREAGGDIVRIAESAEAVASAEPSAVRVDLIENFRSRKGILDFANAVFGRVMKKSVASIDYDDSASLQCGLDEKTEPSESNQPAASGKPHVELFILDSDNFDDTTGTGDNNDNGGSNTDSSSDSGAGSSDGGYSEDDFEVQPGEQSEDVCLEVCEKQAWLIAQRIRQLTGAETGLAELQIHDRRTNTRRNLCYGDIVVLMRSPLYRINDYLRIFELAGVPASTEGSSGYFEATEIRDCLSLLRVLDNPQQDIELASVLRSRFFRITDTELATVRAYGSSFESSGGKATFYQCVCAYITGGADQHLRQRLGVVMDQLRQWQQEAARISLAELLWKIFRFDGYMSFVLACPSGRARRANLLKLHQRAIQFEGFAGSKTGSLGRFVEFIEKLLEAGQDWSAAQTDAETENAVRIMSIHKSKGLEFPVVFVAELESRFNFSDCSYDCVVGDAGALGLRVVEPVSNTKLSSLAHEVIAERKRRTILAEEMRILYVALTRAREKLILAASAKSSGCRETMLPVAFSPDSDPADWQLLSANCQLDWILQALGNQERLYRLYDIQPIRPSSGEKGSEAAGGDDLFAATRLDSRQVREIEREIDEAKKKGRKTTLIDIDKAIASECSDDIQHLWLKTSETLAWRYPWQQSCRICAKTSVSALAAQEEPFGKISPSAAGLIPSAVINRRLRQIERIEPVLLGTASHLVLQKIPLIPHIDRSSIGTVIARLVRQGQLPAGVAGKVNIDSMADFFRKPPGSLAIEYAGGVLREWPFTLGVDANRFAGQAGNEIPAEGVSGSRKVIAKGQADNQKVIVEGVVDMIIQTAQGLVVIDFKTDRIGRDAAAARVAGYRTQMEYYCLAARKILRQKIVSAWIYFLEPALAVAVDIDRSGQNGE